MIICFSESVIWYSSYGLHTRKRNDEHNDRHVGNRAFLSDIFFHKISPVLYLFFVSLYIVSFNYLLSPFVSYIIFSSYHFLTVWTSTLSATRHQSFQIISQIWGLRIIYVSLFFFLFFFGGGGGKLIDWLIVSIIDCLVNGWMDWWFDWLTDWSLGWWIQLIDWLID